MGQETDLGDPQKTAVSLGFYASAFDCCVVVFFFLILEIGAAIFGGYKSGIS